VLHIAGLPVVFNADESVGACCEEKSPMSTVVEAPLEMVEAVAALRLPPRGDRRLQSLMDRNNDGALSAEEREELEALVELSQTIALVRAQALQVLGRKPG
jgi:hypothetical protein